METIEFNYQNPDWRTEACKQVFERFKEPYPDTDEAVKAGIIRFAGYIGEDIMGVLMYTGAFRKTPSEKDMIRLACEIENRPYVDYGGTGRW